MNKTEMLAELERRLGSHGAAVSALDAVLDTLQEAVAVGDKVTLTGFGTFERVTRPARTGRNPRTGEPLEIAATWLPHFRAGTGLRAAVAAGTTTRPAARVAAAPSTRRAATSSARAARTTADATSDTATGPEPIATAGAPAEPSGATAPGSKAPGSSKAPGGSKAPGKKTSGAKAPGKKASGAKAPGKKTSAKAPTGKTSAAKKSAGKKGTAKGSAKKSAGKGK